MSSQLEPEFVNRYGTIKKLTTDIESNQKQKVFFISSNSGVGKSRLCNEILKDIESTSSKVKVSLGDSKAFNAQDGFYIKQIAQYINKNFNELQVISFEDFLRIDIEKHDLDNFLLKIAEDYLVKSPIYKNTKEIFEKFFTFGKFDTEKIFNTNLSDAVHYSYSYIQYCVKQQYFIINIENIQNIDLTSLGCLREILSVTPRIYLLLEYTTNSNATWKLIGDLEKELGKDENDILFDTEQLHPLSTENLFEILKNDNILLKQYISSSYEQWNGNLRPIIDIHFKLNDFNEKNIQEYFSNSANKLNNLLLNDLLALSEKEKHLLLLIATHSDPVDINILNQLHKINEYHLLSTIFDFELDLDKLVKKRFLRKSAKTYIINDDTILDLLLTVDSFSVNRDLVMKLWLKIYNMLYQYENVYFLPKSQLLYYILDFSIKLEEEQSLLKYINELFFLFRNSTPIWVKEWIDKILQLLGHTLNENMKNLILIRLAEITENLALSKLSLRIIDKISDSSNMILLSKAILYEELSEPNKSLEIIENVLNKKEEISIQLFLYCQVTLIACYRSLNKYKAGQKIFKNLMKEKNTYNNIMEFGYVLRQAGSLYNQDTAIPYIKESIEHFERFKAYKQIVHTKIELSIIYIRQKKYDNARQELVQAQKFDNIDFIDEYIIVNNLATINIMQRVNLKETFTNLKNSLSTIQLPFDKLTIYINLLIVMTLMESNEDDVFNLSNTIHELCLLDKPSDKEIRRRAYFNICLSCIKYKNEKLFNFYKECFFSIEISEHRNNLDEELNSLNFTNNTNLITNKFVINNLAHWHVEFDNILENFQ